ncbi:hypothetical protein MPSEU_000681800 [Mayamaea pseudoterrestris]|nr:hypothetical protein MPSEU_000681800 [Mayamaea pseudoterrestris]
MNFDRDSSTRIWVQQSAIESLKGSNNASFSSRQNKSFRTASSNQSFHGSLNSSFNSFADNDSCFTDTSGSSNNRTSQWGWRLGYLVGSDAESVVVKLDSPLPDAPEDGETINLPPTAIQAGQVVLGNDYPCNEEGIIQPPHDLITLTHLHEPAVVESLQHRYAMDQIYTNTGPVLLALNPFQSIRNLYGESVMKKYFERAERNIKSELPPHVYAIADSSYRNMMRKLEENLNAVSLQANQSILVSGESGSGKTVSTKFLMKYLAALSQRSTELQAPEKRAHLKVKETNAGSSGMPSPRRMSPSKSRAYDQPSWSSLGKTPTKPPAWRKSILSNNSKNDADNVLSGVSLISAAGGDTIEAQVLQSNPILESFGNARTVRNDNSSRFGKYIDMQFTRSGKLVGAKIDTYLLEKVRLVTQSHGERNYHIFYELLSGDMDARELTAFFLARTATPEDFKMTARGTYGRRDGVSDRETYRTLRQALQTMKFTSEDAKDILGLTAAILHASNLTFNELSEETCALDKMNVHLLPVCSLLGVAPEALNESLCSFTIQAGNNTIKRSLQKDRAYKGLQGLLKATYSGLFDYLVKRINESIAFKEQIADEDTEIDNSLIKNGSSSKPVASIGILDIFGFESFVRNSFEQLCINYCNEALQQQFNAFVLKNEQAEYEREGIEWSFIEFPENQDVLDLLEKRGSGILSILDDQCRAPGPSDKAFALSLYNSCKSQTRFVTTRKQQANLQFSVLHYAGPVAYTAEGFVEKNRDELPKESIELLGNSKSVFVRSLACFMEQRTQQPIIDTTKPPTPAKIHRADSVVGRATVGEQFKRQLKILRQKIDLTTPHFVRCLKPNDALVPDAFEQAVVADQLRCGGILEAVRVARAGFTQHYPHAEFIRRYRALAWKELSRKTTYSSPCNKQYSRPRNFSFASTSPKRLITRPTQNNTMSAADAEATCKDLVKLLYRKLILLETDDSTITSESALSEAPTTIPTTAEAKNYWSSLSSKVLTSPATSEKTNKVPPKSVGSMRAAGLSLPPVPFPKSSGKDAADSNGKNCPAPLLFSSNRTIRAYSNSEANSHTDRPLPISPTSAWKKGGLNGGDYAKVGIQMGKTKVFLRHQAFEALERIRSNEQTRAATTLNAMFRRYLARLAFVPVRNAFRLEVHDLRQRFDEAKEMKEDDFDPFNLRAQLCLVRTSFQAGDGGYSASLVDMWCESQIRNAIHNPVPRHQWGMQAPSKEATFKWVINEGLWVKNYSYSD